MAKRDKWGSLAQYKKVCAKIAEERGQHCEDCGRFIYELCYWNFHHTKGRTKNYLNPDTIDLLCKNCHSARHGINNHTNL